MFGHKDENARLDALYKKLEDKNAELLASRDELLASKDEQIRILEKALDHERERSAEHEKARRHRGLAAIFGDTPNGLSGWLLAVFTYAAQAGLLVWLIRPQTVFGALSIIVWLAIACSFLLPIASAYLNYTKRSRSESWVNAIYFIAFGLVSGILLLSKVFTSHNPVIAGLAVLFMFFASGVSWGLVEIYRLIRHADRENFKIRAKEACSLLAGSYAAGYAICLAAAR